MPNEPFWKRALYASASFLCLAMGTLGLFLAYDLHQWFNGFDPVFVEARASMKSVAAAAEDLRDMAGEGKRASKIGADYLQAQTQLFQSTPYQKSLKASFDIGAHANSLFRSLNKEIVPEFRTFLRDGSTVLVSSNTAVLSLNDFIGATNKNVNTDLLPTINSAIADLAKQSGLTISSIDKAVISILSKSEITLGDLHSIMSDPSWKAALANTASFTKHSDELMGNFAKGSESVPDIAISIQKILKESSRFARAAAILNLISILAKLR